MNWIRDTGSSSSLPISVDSTPRVSTPAATHSDGSADFQLHAEGVTQRQSNVVWNVDGDEQDVDDEPARDEDEEPDDPDPVPIVDQFNEGYLQQVQYYEKNYEPIEAMRVSKLCGSGRQQ